MPTKVAIGCVWAVGLLLLLALFLTVFAIAFGSSYVLLNVHLTSLTPSAGELLQGVGRNMAAIIASRLKPGGL